MPKDRRDECGPIPDEVQVGMIPHNIPGWAPRTIANLQFADGALGIVESTDRPYATAGTRLTLVEAQRRGIVRRVVDDWRPSVITHLAETYGFTQPFTCTAQYHLMVAGPRRSRWAAGEDVAFAVVLRLLERALGRMNWLSTPLDALPDGGARVSDAPNRAEQPPGLPPSVEVAGCQTLGDGVTPRRDEAFGRLLEIECEGITIRHRDMWDGDAIVHMGGYRWVVDARRLARGTWDDVTDDNYGTVRMPPWAAKRATAMAAAAYVTWTLRTALNTPGNPA
jgi:hypothetical protein